MIRTALKLKEKALEAKHAWQEFVGGTVLPADDDLPQDVEPQYATGVRVHTGKAESEWLGALLIQMAAAERWQMVPYRMLRNRYLRLPTRHQFLRRWDRQAKFLVEEPSVTYTIGGPIPFVEFQIGVTELRNHGYAKVVQRNGETYFGVTQKLLDAAHTFGAPLRRG